MFKLRRRSFVKWWCASGLAALAAQGRGAGGADGQAASGAKEERRAMRIKSIRAFQPPTPGSPPDWRTQLGQIVVEVETESGLVGIGVGGGGAASIHVIQTVLRDLLVGRDA